MSVVADNERTGQLGVRDHFCSGAADGIFPHHSVQSFLHEWITCEFLESIMTNIDYKLEPCIKTKQRVCRRSHRWFHAFFAAVHHCWIHFHPLVQISTITPSKCNFNTEYFILFVYCDNIYPVWLQISLMVNCSCIVVALIAICLITVDVTHGRLGLGREKLLQVSPNQSNQTHHNVEKLTETFVMNSWCCWNSTCWCSRSSCRQSSASASRLLLQRKTLKIVLMAPADLYIRGRGGGVQMGYWRFSFFM